MGSTPRPCPPGPPIHLCHGVMWAGVGVLPAAPACTWHSHAPRWLTCSLAQKPLPALSRGYLPQCHFLCLFHTLPTLGYGV